MITISFGSSFKRAYKKRVAPDESLKNKFQERTIIFQNNPFDPSLHTHKLSGSLDELWSYRVDYEIRIVFYFTSPDHTVLVDIGTHDEVY